MENRLLEGRPEQRPQQSDQLALNVARRASASAPLKQPSPGESLQMRLMRQARNQSGGL